LSILSMDCPVSEPTHGDPMSSLAGRHHAGQVAGGAEKRSAPSSPPRRLRLAEDIVQLAPRDGISPRVFAEAYGLVEGAMLLVAGCFAGWYAGTGLNGLAAGIAGAGLAATVLWATRAHSLRQLLQRGSGAARALQIWAVSTVVASAMVHVLGGSPLETAVFAEAMLAGGLIAVVSGRMFVHLVAVRLMRRGRLEQLAVVVGGGPRAEAIIADLDKAEAPGLRICGVFDDRADERSPDLVAGYPKLGSVEDLVEHVRRIQADLVIVALPLMAERRVFEVTRRLAVLPVDVRIAPGGDRLALSRRGFDHIGHVPLLRLIDKPLAGWNAVLKWLFDRVVGAILLVAVAPVMLAVAVAVKLDSPGPVLFRQRRYGFNNEPIDVYKFRSMRIDMTDPSGWRVVTRGDPRVTRVGRFIRKTSLDELPQLVNVLVKGNLSLVGPRPHPLQARAVDRLFEDAVDGYFARHRVKPGVTGWAQVNGWRGEVDRVEKLENRVKFDLHYIENWSLLFDLYILLRTPLALARTENAY
jgi:Undecaprenyl-phosphate glucose phosphotransferase